MTAEKEFVISHVFKDVSSMGEIPLYLSPIEMRFGMRWHICVQRRADHFGMYLHCLPEKKDMQWSIEVWKEQKIRTVNGKTHSIADDVVFKDTHYGRYKSWCRFIKWEDLLKGYVIDDTLKIEIRVKIKKMTGINLRNFDRTTEEFADVVLVVENKKFYVSKLLLASQSPFFKSTLLKLSESKGHPEHTLEDVKAADFQKFLELLHGEPSISESNIEKILHLAVTYEATLAIQKCEQFLLENSKKSLREKLQLAHRYKLEKLKIMTTDEKEFVISHIFKDVSSMNDDEFYLSPTKDHFGVPWRICVTRMTDHLSSYLYCLQEKNDEEWSIEVSQERKISTMNEKTHSLAAHTIFQTTDKRSGWVKKDFIKWDDFVKDYVVDDTFKVEFRVKIKKMTGIHLRNFDESTKEVSDVALVVENQNLNVSKPIMTTEEKGFVFSHVFKNVSSLKDDEFYLSSIKDHFGVSWVIYTKRMTDHLGLYLYCFQENNDKEWSMEVFQEQVIRTVDGKTHSIADHVIFGSTDERSSWGTKEFIKWEELMKDYVIDNTLTVEFRVKIKKMTGSILKENMKNHRSCDESTKEFSDVVLVVDNQNLNVSKPITATAEKEFVISHVFRGVSSMNDDEFYFSPIEKRFGVPWKIGVERMTDHIGIYLHCLQQKNGEEWSIEVFQEGKITTVNEKTHSSAHHVIFKSTDKRSDWGKKDLIKWDDFVKDYVVDDIFKVEIRVKIKRMTGTILRNFDESAKEVSDVALVVENHNFNVSKPIMTTDEKGFVFSHVFKNVSSLKDDEFYISPTKDHFGVPWKIGVELVTDHLCLYLHCLQEKNNEEWSIEVWQEQEIRTVYGKTHSLAAHSIFKSTDTWNGWGLRQFIEWDDLMKDYVVDDTLKVKIRVLIKKMTGIILKENKKNLRNFDESNKEVSDVVQVVEKQKFNVSKPIMTTAEKEFVISHVFRDVSSMEDKIELYSPIVKHFRVSWKIGVQRNTDYLGLFLHCEPENKDKEWSIQVWQEGKIKARNRKAHSIADDVIFKDTCEESDWGWNDFIKWDDLMKNYVSDDTFKVEIRVKIKRMTGIILKKKRKNLQKFDESTKEVSDVVPVVENQNFDVSNPIMPTAEKEFVISHDFKNVSSMKYTMELYSPIEEYFGVPWKISLYRYANHLRLFLYCEPEEENKEWSIEVWKKQELRTVTGKTDLYANEFIFEDTRMWGGWDFIQCEDLMKDYVVDDTLRVKIRVKIKKMTGINLRNFDESTKQFSDVVLIVENQRFFVSKLFLARQSSFFKSTLLKLSGSEGLLEHTLQDVKAADFQKFLEFLYGESSISESNVERIFLLANTYEVILATRKCEQFLMESSKKSLKEKLQLAHRYKSEKLKYYCLSKISSTGDIRAALDDNLNEMDPSVVGTLLEKSLDLYELYSSLTIAGICCTCLLLPLLFCKGSKNA